MRMLNYIKFVGPTSFSGKGDSVMAGGVRQRDVGRFQFTLFAGPDGDHYLWRVTRTNFGPDTADRFGKKLVDGMARNEEEAWRLAESWLDGYLREHPDGG